MNALIEFGLVLSDTKRMIRVLVPVEFTTTRSYIVDIPHHDKFRFFYEVDTIIDLTNRMYVKRNGSSDVSGELISDNTYWAYKMIPDMPLEEFLYPSDKGKS